MIHILILMLSLIPLPDEAFYPQVPSARGVAMGGAIVALPDYATPALYNPAMLNFLEHPYIAIGFSSKKTTIDGLQEASSLSGRGITFLGFATYQGALFWAPLFNAHYTREDTSEVYSRFNEFGISLTSLTGQEQKLTPDRHFLMGANIKYFYGLIAYANPQKSEAWITSGHGAGFDVGVTFHYSPIILSIAGRNLLSRVWWKNGDKSTFPITGRIGASFKARTFLFAGEIEFNNDPLNPIYHIGTEWSGVHIGEDQVRIPLQLGVEVKDENLIVSAGITMQYSHQILLNLAFWSDSLPTSTVHTRVTLHIVLAEEEEDVYEAPILE